MLLAKRVRSDLRPFTGALALFLFLSPWALRAEESHPGLSIEPMYSEAVIAYNKKQSGKALEILNDLLKQDPKHVEALQLKALTLKGKGNDAEAEDTYRRLIALKPEKECGPYYFELAVLYHHQNMVPEATLYFHKAIAQKTNIGASNLFLGIMNFTAGKLNEAESNFDEVASDGDPEMKMVGRYYLGLINLKNGNGSVGTDQMVEARSLSSSIPDSPMAKGIHESTQKMLEPFDRGSFFLTANFLPQFDSNLSQTPLTGPAPSGTASVKLNASGGGGWVSSPMSTWQWVGSVKASGNLNMNPIDAGYQYATLTPDLYLTYKPLSRLPRGIKLEANYTIQSTMGTDGNYAFRPFSPYAITFDIGPFVRWMASARTSYQLDFGMRQNSYPTLTDYSGADPYVKLSMKHDGANRFFNPLIALAVDNTQTRSWTTGYIGTSFEVNNTMRFDPTKTLTFDVMATEFAYYQANRYDGNLALHPTFLWNIRPRWSVLADLSYTINTSTDGTYSYNRWTSGVGVSYTLQ